MPIADLVDRLTLWHDSIDKYRVWGDLSTARILLLQNGLSAFVDMLDRGELHPDRAVEQLRHARAEAVWSIACKERPDLVRLDGGKRSTLVDIFKRLDLDQFQANAALIRVRRRTALPQGAVGDMAVIRGEIARKRGHKPIRKLMQQVGKTIQQIKPIFLMSPISVSQFIPPGVLEFDLLVIDEASQVRPEDALGAMARAKQIVVVGDSKQLPPTNFFNRLLSDEEVDEDVDDDSEEESPDYSLKDAAKVTELESILTLCEARGLLSKMLRWHYRSRHPSLIAVSNKIFYDSNLLLPPSPTVLRGDDGLIVHRVSGAYERGGKRINAIEGQAVVKKLIELASNCPNRSAGIVTFSTTQRDLIANLLDEARRRVPTLVDEGSER